MKAILIRSFGGSDVLESADVPRPEVADGEVLVRVRAAGVNPVDTKVRSGSFAKSGTRLPAVLGRDVAGRVEAVGRGVTGTKVGDEVYAFLGSHSGGYAEFALAKESELAAKPVSLDFEHAAAVPLAATTAWQALFDHGRLQRGQRVLIHGASGGVGHFAVQFAKARGATVIVTARGEDASFLRQLGADEVIDYENERFEERARDIDLVIDLIAGETQERSWNVLKDGGAIVSTLQQPAKDKAAAHKARGEVFMAEPRHDQLVEIGRLIDEGKVHVTIQHAFPLRDARKAHDSIEHEHTRGKVVLKVA